MKARRRNVLQRLAVALFALFCAGSKPSGGGDGPAPALAFAIQDGKSENRFFRQGSVAAHLVATSGEVPRLVVAFPAGNVGAGLWFEGRASRMTVEGELSAVERPGHMRGVVADIRVEAPELRLNTAILGSVRALRDFGHDGNVMAGLEGTISPGPPVVLKRASLDGAHHLEVSLEALQGRVAVGVDGRIALTAGEKGCIVVRTTVLSDEAPLTAVPAERIFTADAAEDVRARSALAFLTYEEKILAGSWQYLTYFGRDTLLSTRLLMPVLRPHVVEAALGAVIERLSEDGDVAHEENLGEGSATLDYKMVDDDFMLAPVVAAYLESEAGRSRAAAFFGRRTSHGRTFSEMVRKNLDRVMAQAEPFATRPAFSNLIPIGDGLVVGNWRDSDEGLGGGRFAYDVNAALVPAALRAASRLYALDGFGKDLGAAAHARERAEAWGKAEPMFRVSIEAEEARRRLKVYGSEQGMDVDDALAAIDGTVSFPALALDASGAPIPVEHTDDGFVMMFGEPSDAWLVSAARRIVRPFPAGLRTPVGMVVANPAYAAEPALRSMFTRDHYHGTVVWSWQQALLLSGLRRQVARTDLDGETTHALAQAEEALARVIEATKSQRTSELWSFSVDAQGYHVVPFGQAAGHHSEGNAVQLWSTIFLALDRKS